MSYAFGVPFAMLLFLLMSFRFLALILVAFLVGQSAALCSISQQYPQRPLNAFLGPFLLEGPAKRA